MFERAAGIAAGLALVLTACGGEGASTPETPPVATTVAAAETTAATTDAEPEGAGFSTTAPCDRITPEELSAAFNVTFGVGDALDEGQCLFDSDATNQVLLIARPGDRGLCVTMGGDYETVEIAGNPGWWDEASGQARACLPDGFVAVMVSGVGANSAHREAVLELTALATTR